MGVRFGQRPTRRKTRTLHRNVRRQVDDESEKDEGNETIKQSKGAKTGLGREVENVMERPSCPESTKPSVRRLSEDKVSQAELNNPPEHTNPEPRSTPRKSTKQTTQEMLENMGKEVQECYDQEQRCTSVVNRQNEVLQERVSETETNVENEEELNPAEWQIKKRRGDGHCLLYALLGEDNWKKAIEWRQTFADWIEKNTTTVIGDEQMSVMDWIVGMEKECPPDSQDSTTPNSVVKRYIQGVRNRAHLGYLEVVIFSRLTNVEVRTYVLLGATYKCWATSKPKGSPQSVKYLLYKGQHRWE